MKSHQLGKVLHWQIDQNTYQRGRKESHLPRHPVARSGCLPVRREGTSVSSEHCSTLQPSACCSFATRHFREKHRTSRTLASHIFKVRGSRDKFCPGSFTASELVHHSTEHFLLEDLSWGPASGCCGQCEYLE